MIARQLWINFDNQPSNAPDLLMQAQDNVKHLPAIGRAWIEFLESVEGQKIINQFVAKLPTVQKDVLQQLLSANPAITTSNPQRLARNIAYNRMVFAVLCQHPVLGALFKRYDQEYIESIRTIGDTMAQKAVESNPALIFISIIRDMLNSGSGVLLEGTSAHSTDDINDSEARRMIGYKAPKGGAYLVPARVQSAIDYFVGKDALASVTPNSLYKRLCELGYLASVDNNGNLPSKKIRGKTMRVLHLTEQAITYEPTSSD
jgi:hypothetical protein